MKHLRKRIASGRKKTEDRVQKRHHSNCNKNGQIETNKTSKLAGGHLDAKPVERTGQNERVKSIKLSSRQVKLVRTKVGRERKRETKDEEAGDCESSA
jgi:hypothetical protein